MTRCTAPRCRKEAETFIRDVGAFCDPHNEERLEREMHKARKRLGL